MKDKFSLGCSRVSRFSQDSRPSVMSLTTQSLAGASLPSTRFRLAIAREKRRAASIARARKQNAARIRQAEKRKSFLNRLDIETPEQKRERLIKKGYIDRFEV